MFGRGRLGPVTSWVPFSFNAFCILIGILLLPGLSVLNLAVITAMRLMVMRAGIY